MKKIRLTFKIKWLIVLLLLILIINYQNFGQSIPPAAPTAVMATPSSVTCGGNSNLTANTTGGNVIIRWWTASSGGTLLNNTTSGTAFSVTPTFSTIYYSEAYDTSTNLPSNYRVSINVTVIPLPVPTNVLVYPNPVQCGNNSNLFATSFSGTIKWWDAATGGNLLGSSQSGVFFSIIPTNSIIYYAESYFANSVSYSFIYTGLTQTFIIPPGVIKLSIDATGASGGKVNSINSSGGMGGRVQTNLNVTPGMVLYIFVGGQGSNFGIGGWNGGGGMSGENAGGGGASDIRIGGISLLNRVVIAGGGGGGGGYSNGRGGAGGGLTGGNGLWNSSYSQLYCGAGGSQTAGGTGSADPPAHPGGSGTFGIGGDGSLWVGSGGGGGYFGGGGSYAGGAGGGSNWVDTMITSNTTNIQGYQTGNGQIIITCYNAFCTSTRIGDTVSVSGIPVISQVTANPSIIFCGDTSNINSISAGNFIRWWDAPTGGNLLDSVASGINYSVNPVNSTTYYAEACTNNCASPRMSITVTVNALNPPTLVTSTPSNIYCGLYSNLNASTSQGIIRWWDSASGGNMLGTSASGSNFIANLFTTTTYYAESYTNILCTSSRASITVTVNSLPAPTSLIANPNPINCGGNTNLYAISFTNSINWWDAAVGGNLIGVTQNDSFINVTPSFVNTTYYAETFSQEADTQTFVYTTNTIYTWSVPMGIASITIEARGASGGYTIGGSAGRGAIMKGVFPVSSGIVFSILVGQSPGLCLGYYPGGGGGTYVALGSSFTTATPLIVAGGGGGGTQWGTGIDAPVTTSGTGIRPGTNGNGAPIYGCNGGGGGFYTSGGNGANGWSGGGGFQQGGTGGCPSLGYTGYQCGGFGGGTSGNFSNNCQDFAGNGGGYSGGSSNVGVGIFYGEAGGSYNVGNNQMNFSGIQGNTGNGKVIFSWITPLCTSNRTSITVSINVNISAPSVSANPSSIICGVSSNLVGVSLSNIIRWWDSAISGNFIGSTTNGTSLNVLLSNTTTFYAEAFLNPCISSRVSVTISVASISSPTSVGSIPAIVSCGSGANLYANNSSGIIKWWNASSGGSLIGSSISGSNYYIIPQATTTYYAESYSGGSGIQSFGYTGSIQFWSVPLGISTINIDASGAQGGSSTLSGGMGGRVEATLSVTQGQILNIFVGGRGGNLSGGWNGGGSGSGNGSNYYGGGGGGATDIRIGGTELTNRIIVAGGGGGGTWTGTINGGSGGGLIAGDGLYNYNTPSYDSLYCGSGGTQVSGGRAATYTMGSNPATVGVLGYGGSSCVLSGYNFSGGGGGGYYGGGGSSKSGGGGGGSSWSDTVLTTNVIHTQGYDAGDGQLIISWNSPFCVSSRVSVTVAVNSTIQPPMPVNGTPSTISCGGNSTLNAISTGNIIRWWDASSGGAMLGTSASGINFIVFPTNTFTYYAEAFNICSSTRVSVTVTVNSSVQPPVTVTATPLSVSCGGYTNLNAISSGNIIRWWDASEDGTMLGTSNSGSNFIVYLTSNITYYAEAFNVCPSSRKSVTITVVPYISPIVSASPSSFCGSGISSLSGITTANTIYWWSSSSGGTLFGSSVSGEGFPVTLTTTITYYADLNYSPFSGSQIFNYTGSIYNWTVPPGVISIESDIRGAQGGSGGCDTALYNAGGYGGRLQGTFAVISGQILYIYVGGKGGDETFTLGGTGGYNGGGIGGMQSGLWFGGGGGGGSDIRIGGTNLTNRIFAAGGGGGGGDNSSIPNNEKGGIGGATTSLSGAGFFNGTNSNTSYCGQGGTLNAGGAAGTNCIGTASGFGIGGNVCSSNSGGGGGGGYFGGGCGSHGGGGGGSNYYDLSASGVVSTPGFQSGNGQISLIWYSSVCTCSRVSITVTANEVPSQPSQITGNTTPQAGNSELYSVINDINATSYFWTFPSGWTGISNYNSITFIVGASLGTITVVPSNACGSGLARTLNISNGFTISGYFTYDNATHTPLDSVWVFLMQNGIKMDSVQADINGFYELKNVNNGIYYLNATTHKIWTGVNSGDAVKVKRHFAGSELFTSSIQLHAADVNLTYSINTTDAVKIVRRFVGSDTSFTRGDWIFEKPLKGDTLNVSVYMNDTVNVNGDNVTQNFAGLCVGDVNGSNLPLPGAKSNSKVKIDFSSNDIIKLNSGDYFELPVMVANDINVGAISLIINYPKNLIRVENFETSNNLLNEIYYKITSNQIRIGWFENNGQVKLYKGETLFKIKFQTLSNFKTGDIIKFTIANDPLCEFADEKGNSIDNVVLKTYTIEHSTGQNIYNTDVTSNIDMYIFPNPTDNAINIKYNVAKVGLVKISLYIDFHGIIQTVKAKNMTHLEKSIFYF